MLFDLVSDSGDPIDGSPPDSTVPGIFQARVLEWGATDLWGPPLPSDLNVNTLYSLSLPA